MMFIDMFKIQAKEYPKLAFGLGYRLDDDHVTRVWLMSVLFLVAVTIVLMPAYYLDGRVLDSAPIWAKPIKFSVSLTMHFLTLVLLAKQLGCRHRAGITLTFFGYAAVASMLLEQLYITIQAARGRQSHFNGETDFEALMFSVMGVGAVFLVLASFVLGLMIWKYGKKNHSGLRLGSILGLILGSVLTLYYGMAMGNIPSQSHLIGEAVSNANVPLMGWSREVGDLRIPHFLATHMMQILPLTGLIFDRLRMRPRAIVSIMALLLTTASAAAFSLALSGTAVFPV